MENNKLKSFRDLKVWQKAVSLATLVYSITEKFPKSELYGITNQMRRSAVSISSNIAEGFKRNHGKEKLQFYNIAYGSTAELESQIEVSYRLNFFDNQDYKKLSASVVEIGKMIDGLIKSQNRKFPKSYILNSIFLFIFLYSISYILNPLSAQAATLYFSPSSGSYSAGEQFSVRIYASSAEQAMNAVSGAISFPTDKLEIKSISKTGSIISLWVQEPSFFSGSANFEGIVLNPGYTGPAGKIIAVNFRAKSAGLASLNFSSGSVLANDGKGTNILTSLGNAQFSLGGVALTIPEATIPPVVPGAPSAPAIFSPTHPDELKWYNNPKPKFVWDLPEGVIAVRLLYDKNSDSRPAVLYEPPILEKELDEAKDGVYYFHAQFRNKNGWGGISHFKFQIDTVPPELGTIKFIDGKETDNSQPTIAFEAKDNLSGIDYYKIKIGKGDPFDIRPETSDGVLFALPRQSPGKRTITVQVFDKAGNYISVADEFIIKPTQPAEVVKESKIGKIQNIWSWTISLFIMTIILAGLIILFLLIVWWAKYRLSLLKKKVSKETKEAEDALHRAIIMLKEDIEKQVKMLEMTKRLRNLTDEEEKIIKHLKKDLDDAEKFVRKEIEDIEKQAK